MKMLLLEHLFLQLIKVNCLVEKDKTVIEFSTTFNVMSCNLENEKIVFNNIYSNPVFSSSHS